MKRLSARSGIAFCCAFAVGAAAVCAVLWCERRVVARKTTPVPVLRKLKEGLRLKPAQRRLAGRAFDDLVRKTRSSRALMRLWRNDLSRVRLAGAPLACGSWVYVVFETKSAQRTVFDFFVVTYKRTGAKLALHEVTGQQKVARIALEKGASEDDGERVDFTFSGWAFAYDEDNLLRVVGESIKAGDVPLTAFSLEDADDDGPGEEEDPNKKTWKTPRCLKLTAEWESGGDTKKYVRRMCIRRCDVDLEMETEKRDDKDDDRDEDDPDQDDGPGR